MDGRIAISSSRRFTAFTLDLPHGAARGAGRGRRRPGEGPRVSAGRRDGSRKKSPRSRSRCWPWRCSPAAAAPAATARAAVRAEATKTTTQVVVQTASEGFDAAKVYREASPGVVTIRSIFDESAAEGSGFVLDTKGRIVTNAHVVTDGEGSDRKEAKAVFVEFPDRNEVPAKIVGFDPFADVALLEVEARRLRPAPAASSATTTTSSSASRWPRSATRSASSRRSRSGSSRRSTARSARSPSSRSRARSRPTPRSTRATPVGRCSKPAPASSASTSRSRPTPEPTTASASPCRSRRSSARSPSSSASGSAEYAYIGVSTQALYPQLAAKLGLDTDHGGLLAEVIPGGPADEAGLKGGDEKVRFQGIPYQAGGDTILAVDGRQVVEPDDLARYISDFQPGEKVKLDVLHEQRRSGNGGGHA